MRVLFVAAPAVGHLFPLVPLARTLRAHGHEVLFASFDGAEPVTGSGLPLANIAPGVKVYEELFKAGKEHRPDLLERSTATLGADREAFVALFAHVNDRVADGLVDLAGRWRPDLVVYEYISPIGLLAAAAVGVPAVQHDLGFVRTPGLRDVMLTELAGAFARHGIPSAPEPAEVIDITPPSMIDGGRYGVPMRPVPYNGEGTLPPLSDRTPKIAVTIGTVSAAMMGGLDRVRRIVEAAPETLVDRLNEIALRD
jgi:UDP:flavonoid glycosyltransferase YjiC (YdhE family)